MTSGATRLESLLTGLNYGLVDGSAAPRPKLSGVFSLLNRDLHATGWDHVLGGAMIAAGSWVAFLDHVGYV